MIMLQERAGALVKRATPPEQRSFLALPAILICLLCNLALFAGVRARNPDYLHDYRGDIDPDAQHYVLLGRNVLQHGCYSRCAQPPYAPDMLRTPVYPLFAGALDWLGGPSAIYLAQALCQAGSCWLLFRLVQSCFGARAAFWAALLLAVDLMLAVYNFEAMSEPLFVLFLLAALNCLVPSMLRLTTGERGGMGRLAAGGALLGLTILTRPAGLYLPVLLVGGLVFLGWRRRCLPRALAAAAILLLAVLPLPALWIARNAVVFSLPRLTTVDAANNVYFIGGGAYQLHFQVSLEEAQARIAREYHLPTYAVSQNPWIGDRPLSEIDRDLRQASFSVMTKYPFESVEACLLGVVKASFSHNVGRLAYLLGNTWSNPGTGDLLRLRANSWRRFLENSPVLVIACGWQMFHVLLSLALAGFGIVITLRAAETRPAAWILLFVLAYFYLTVAVFGLEAFYRCRIPVLPFLYAFSGVGLIRVWQSSKQWLAGKRAIQLPSPGECTSRTTSDSALTQGIG